MARRSSSEIAEALEADANRKRAEADRRRAVASDEVCCRLWEAECTLARAGLATNELWLKEALETRVRDVREWREARWADLKKKLDTL